MGSCVSFISQCCGKQEENSQFGESGDRTQLIDPHGDNVTIQRIQSENYYGRYSDGTFPKKSEEHSDLNKILQEMASNVIDVASLGSHSLEQHEYKERISYYANKVKSLTLTRSFSRLPKTCILQDIPNPDKSLANCSVTYDELQSITAALNELDDMVGNMNLGSFEDLIIPFEVQS